MMKSEYLSVGTDIEEIGRFRKMGLNKNKEFLDKVFTAHEQDYCFSKGKAAAAHLAVRYAAKEAVIKALSCAAGKSDLKYRNVEVRNTKIGVPVAIVKDRRFRDLNVALSLSHCADKAIAVAIVTKTAAR